MLGSPASWEPLEAVKVGNGERTLGIARRTRVKIEVSAMDLGRITHLHGLWCVWGFAKGTGQSDDRLCLTPATSTRRGVRCDSLDSDHHIVVKFARPRW